MPSFKHTPTGKRFFFAHIPRTAGRFIEANLLNNDIVWDDSHLDNGLGVMSKVNGFEIAHYHRTHYEKYLDVQGIPHFSIVRNPLTRFKSASIYIKRAYGKDIQGVMEDPFMFSTMIENLPFEESYNWYRPQVDFLRNDTNVWKFENGFGEDFVNWLSGTIGIDLKFDDNIEYPKSKDEGESDSRLELTPDLIHILKHTYRKDIEHLYPELATPL